MAPRRSRGPTGPFLAFVASSLPATSSCALAPDGGASGEPADPDVGNTRHPLSAQTSSTFTLFETGQVRPLALSPDNQLLFAVNLDRFEGPGTCAGHSLRGHLP
jgi:hypothetical protein